MSCSNALETTSYELAFLRLPLAFDGFCIVQISDLHDHQFGPHQSQLLDSVREARPDLIVITGDLVYDGLRRTRYDPDFPQELASIASVCFVTGNHEIHSKHRPMLPEILASLESAGVTVIRRGFVLIHRKSDAIAVAGIDDPAAFEQGGARSTEKLSRWKEELGKVRECVARDLFVVLLSHRPELISWYTEAGFDFVLAGHAHGGQIRFPFIGALYASNQGLLPHYTSGIHTARATTMIVSRGLGTSHIHMRLLNSPELVVVRLRKSM